MPKKDKFLSASSNTKKIKSQKINKKQMSTLVAEELAKKAKDMKIALNNLLFPSSHQLVKR